MLTLSYEHGNAPGSTYAYGLYGAMMAAEGNIDDAVAFGKVALLLVDQLHAPQMRCRALNMFNSCIRHWKEHLPTAVGDMPYGVTVGLDYGDIENASYCAIHYCNNYFFSGYPLREIESSVRYYLALMEKLRQGYATSFLRITLQTILNLEQEHSRGGVLSGDEFDETSLVPQLIASGSNTVLYWYYTAETVLHFLFGNPDEAIVNALQAAPLAGNSVGLIATAELPFYHSLAILSRYGLGAPEIPADEGEVLDRHRALLAHWAGFGKENFQHKADLVEAEYARVSGRVLEAMDRYEHAIAGARDNGFLQEESIAFELAARFYLERGMEDFAALYMKKAYDGFARWQAYGKLEWLERQYPQWFGGTKSHEEESLNVAGGDIDMVSVLRATQAISGELDLAELMASLMTIMVENAGAQNGFLIMERNRDWVVEAEKKGERPAQRLREVRLLDEREDLPAAIVRYVIHTGQNVILHNASHEGPFIRDPHVLRMHPKSILCIRLVTHGRLIGVLYLENNITIAAFTPARIRVLEALAIQAAISLENARYYEELRTLNASLRESEERFRLLAKRVPAPMAIHSPEGEIEYLNDTFIAAFGYNLEDIPNLETWWKKAYPDEAYRGVVQAFWQTRLENATEQNPYIEPRNYRIRCKDGRTRIVEVSSTRIGSSQLVLLNDITEHIESELALKEADKRKDAFIAMLAHELRNPMAAISAAAMLMSMPGVKEDKAALARDSIKRRVRQLSRLVDDLLDVSRITTGKTELRRESLNLETVIAHAVEASKSFFDDRGQRLVVRVMNRLPVFGDAVRLEQAILNLLTNASRYSDEGQTAFLTAEREGAYAVIRVRDEGVGIAPSLLPRIFEPFTQADTSLERTKGGLGLGLTIVKNLCELHGGSVTARSDGEGKGSEFEIRLPISESLGPPGAVAQKERLPSQLRILIAEDHEDTAMMMGEMLEADGHTVVGRAADGPAAVEAALRTKPDVMLLDLGMPGFSGYEVARRVREGGLADTLIVAITGYGQEQDVRRGREVGINEHLLKPVDYQKLEILLAEHAAKGHKPDPGGAQ